MQSDTQNFTDGKILGPLLKFAVPVLLSLLLQSLYGAVDLLVVGRFAQTADVSGVSTGSQFLHLVLSLLGGFAVSITVLLGQKIGENDREGIEKTLSNGIIFFAVGSVILTAVIVAFTGTIVKLLRAPTEAEEATFRYIRICGWGTVFIFAYNLLGSIFRGIGDSRTPLLTVAIACVFNIFGDLFAVCVLKMGAAGAALATVVAQFISVMLSVIIISRRQSEIRLSLKKLTPERETMHRIVKIGFPISIQDILVSISFTVITVIVNSLGLVASAGVGVAEKLCSFVMLIPSACSQSMSAFVAQNVGAGKHDRAREGLKDLIICSLGVSVVIFWAAFFHGDVLASVFNGDPAVVTAAADYLKSYAIDCLLTSFLFCFLGYYNGYAESNFVMLQGLIGAFLVRIPVAYLASRAAEPSLFRVGLATPCSSFVQIVLCFLFLRKLNRKLTGSEIRLPD